MKESKKRRITLGVILSLILVVLFFLISKNVLKQEQKLHLLIEETLYQIVEDYEKEIPKWTMKGSQYFTALPYVKGKDIGDLYGALAITLERERLYIYESRHLKDGSYLFAGAFINEYLPTVLVEGIINYKHKIPVFSSLAVDGGLNHMSIATTKGERDQLKKFIQTFLVEYQKDDEKTKLEYFHKESSEYGDLSDRELIITQADSLNLDCGLFSRLIYNKAGEKGDSPKTYSVKCQVGEQIQDYLIREDKGQRMIMRISHESEKRRLPYWK